MHFTSTPVPTTEQDPTMPPVKRSTPKATTRPAPSSTDRDRFAPHRPIPEAQVRRARALDGKAKQRLMSATGAALTQLIAEGRA